MRKLTVRQARDALLSAAFIGGLATMALGAALIYAPAGVIFAGALAVASCVLYERGSSRG